MVIGIDKQIYNDSLLPNKFSFYQYDEKKIIEYIFDKRRKKWSTYCNYYSHKRKPKIEVLTTLQVVQALKNRKLEVYIGRWKYCYSDTVA